MRLGDNRKIIRIVLLVLAVTIITILHYRTSQLEISTHIIFRELYFLPIILAGFWFGVRGALAVSFSITLFYLPFTLSLPQRITGHYLENILQIVLFNIIGLLIGWLRDREKKQQKKLLEAENLAAMGRAVSCIAHDMKTPLIAIGGLVRQVRRKVEEEGLAQKLEIAIDQVRRLEVLVGDMLAFARPLKLEYSLGKVSDLLREAATIAGGKAELHNVRLHIELQQEMPLFEYDPNRLRQAFLNLINNALEASPPDSQVTLRCHCEQEGAIIEVIDQGEGIPQERQHDIFTPFVTTKKEGTGLGLSIIKKVIDAHSGRIEVGRNGDRGTIFRITLPLKRPSED